MLPVIQLQASHQKRFMLGYPWVYTNEIVQSNLTKELEPGALVHLQVQGKSVATGYFNRHSLIAFRVLSHNPLEAIDVEFFKTRLQQALQLRQHFYPDPYYRLIYAEADGLPGLIIDRFDDVFTIQINTQGMEKLKPILLDALTTLFKPKSIYFKETTMREKEGLETNQREIVGEPFSFLTVRENQTLFSLEKEGLQKTGWFYDHRENRKLIASLAKQKTVLDYFCYCGGFSIQAAMQGATKVIGVDRSEAAIQNAKRSAALNKVENTCEFVCSEVFEDMDKRIASAQTFDIVILDPPAFVKVKKDLPVGLKGYEKLIRKGLQLVANHGFLLIASCSYHVTETDLKTCLTRALSKNGRTGSIVKTLSAGFDHPLHPMLAESAYLKGFLVLCGGLTPGSRIVRIASE